MDRRLQCESRQREYSNPERWRNRGLLKCGWLAVVGRVAVAGLQGYWIAVRIPRSPEAVAMFGVWREVASRLEWSLVAGAVLLVLSAEVALRPVGLLWVVCGLSEGDKVAGQRALAL